MSIGGGSDGGASGAVYSWSYFCSSHIDEERVQRRRKPPTQVVKRAVAVATARQIVLGGRTSGPNLFAIPIATPIPISVLGPNPIPTPNPHRIAATAHRTCRPIGQGDEQDNGKRGKVSGEFGGRYEAVPD